jgi:hypothetical protein
VTELVLEKGGAGSKFKKMLTWRDTTYFPGNFSSGGELKWNCL